MKQTMLHRFKARLMLTNSKGRRRGVAIITVLAIISLMTIIVISFFNMAQTQRATAIGTVEMQRVQNVKDVAINFVVAQIREATTLEEGAVKTIWTSQPGAIRTYSSTKPDLTRVYKLYSSDKILLRGIEQRHSKDLLDKIKLDIPPDWPDQVDEFVDLNKPLVPAAAYEDEDNATKKKVRLVYPVADPSRYNGQEGDRRENAEGFRYGEDQDFQMKGVDPQRGQLAMPLRWIYILEDGTMGTLDKTGEFLALTTSSDAQEKPSKDIPIVARVAWWTDDETCKVNINTASVPSQWDTPRFASAQDTFFATTQPVDGECQRYPGHPAQVDLCAVFFPGYRYTHNEQIIPAGTHMAKLDESDARLIWNIAPYIKEDGGSDGGKKSTVGARTGVDLDKDDHIYASFEEMYFKAQRAEKNLDKKRDNVERSARNPGFLKRLERSQFFLTHKSGSPEMTQFGTPRVCMFPLQSNVIGYIGPNRITGALPNNVAGYEVAIAMNTNLAGRPYYFQRDPTSATSRHNNFFNNFDGRSARLFEYLKRLTEAPLHGYPELSGNGVIGTLATKYGIPVGMKDGAPIRYASKPGTEFDGSDRTQILLSMLDWLRSSNMSPGYFQDASIRYDGGSGQCTGICACTRTGGGVQADHTTVLSDPLILVPKGVGRTYGPAEIIFLFNIPTIKKGGQILGSTLAPGKLRGEHLQLWNNSQEASIVEVGVVMNAFCTKQGWAPLFAGAGCSIAGPGRGGPEEPRQGGGYASPIALGGGNTRLLIDPPNGFDNDSGTNQATGTLPVKIPGHIPWGGIVGARATSSSAVAARRTANPGNNVAIVGYACYTGSGGGGSSTANVQVEWRPPGKLRFYTMDDQAPTNFNITQGIELDAAPASMPQIQAEYTEKVLSELMAASGALSATQAGAFPPGNNKVKVLSWVVPHGDYRLTCYPLKVGSGIFVAHGQDGHSAVEPYTNDSGAAYMVKPGGGRGVTMAEDAGQGGLLFDGANGMRKIPLEFAPHFAPVKPNTLCDPKLGTAPYPGVLETASTLRVHPIDNQTRQKRMAHGRMDGDGSKVPFRGSSDPLETGDFDTGVGLAPDGAYTNHPDEGDARGAMPYYDKLTLAANSRPAASSPNRLIRSPVDFGSLPSGVHARVPWQTLRFRPDPGMFDPASRQEKVNDRPSRPANQDHFFPFSNYCGPKDHMFLDLFWMPVVEPWAISEAFATKGTINLNQQIFPFLYIERTTALHALMRGELMGIVSDLQAEQYKSVNQMASGTKYRYFINARETLRQLTEFRFKGKDAEGNTVPFNSFRSAGELCELWLVPELNNAQETTGGRWNLEGIIRDFWRTRRLTGDNLRERPYANMYPKTTVRSNFYKVHVVAQTLRKSAAGDHKKFNSDPLAGGDQVTAEWRGSAMIERVVNPNDPEIQKAANDYATIWRPTGTSLPKLDTFYVYRVTDVKQFTE